MTRCLAGGAHWDSLSPSSSIQSPRGSWKSLAASGHGRWDNPFTLSPKLIETR